MTTLLKYSKQFRTNVAKYISTPLGNLINSFSGIDSRYGHYLIYSTAMSLKSFFLKPIIGKGYSDLIAVGIGAILQGWSACPAQKNLEGKPTWSHIVGGLCGIGCCSLMHSFDYTTPKLVTLGAYYIFNKQHDTTDTVTLVNLIMSFGAGALIYTAPELLFGKFSSINVILDIMIGTFLISKAMCIFENIMDFSYEAGYALCTGKEYQSNSQLSCCHK